MGRMMTRHWVALSAVGLLTLAGLVPEPPARSARVTALMDGSAELRRLEREAVASAEAAVRARLRDPASAVFDGGFAAGPTGACGWVNARNGFGGYAGRERYVVAAAGRTAVLEGDLPDARSFSALWHRACLGVEPPPPRRGELVRDAKSGMWCKHPLRFDGRVCR